MNNIEYNLDNTSSYINIALMKIYLKKPGMFNIGRIFKYKWTHPLNT